MLAADPATVLARVAPEELATWAASPEATTAISATSQLRFGANISLLMEPPFALGYASPAALPGSGLTVAKPMFVAILRCMGESQLAPNRVVQRAGHRLVRGLRRLRLRVMVEA